MQYRADIDALRAIAVLSVIFFHLGLPLTGGYVGVDVFFVISGYVIARSLEEDLHQGRFSIMRFYNKRIRRIFPALFATLAGTWIAAWVILLPDFFRDFSESFVATATFVSNIYFWRESGYFSPDAMTRPLLHTWSLAVEEQYYIFAPILTWIIYRFCRRNWLATLLPLLLISLALSVVATGKAPTANFFMLPTRAWELLLGALLAHRSPPLPRTAWMGEVLAALGLGLALYPVFAFNDATPFPGLNALYPCLGAALLIYCGQAARQPVLIRALGNRVMAGIGKISYSLYLIHWPVIVFAYFITLGPPPLAMVPGLLALMFVLSVLSWRYVEQPFRRINPDLRPGRIVACGIGMIALFTVIGIAGVTAKGFPTRFPDYKQQTIPGSDHADWKVGTCFLTDPLDITKWSAKDCTRISGNGRRVLLWGDSHAAHYIPGLLASRFEGTLLQYTGSACPPILSYQGFNAAQCRRMNENALTVIRDNKIDTVILAARWSNMKPDDIARLRETLDRLDEMKIHAYVIGPSPEFAIDPQVIAYYKDHNQKPDPDRCTTSSNPDLGMTVEKIAGPDRYIDPISRLCNGTQCPCRDGNKMLFEDRGHFSREGSRKAVMQYFPMTSK